jgi:hypothetical protein
VPLRSPGSVGRCPPLEEFCFPELSATISSFPPLLDDRDCNCWSSYWMPYCIYPYYLPKWLAEITVPE